MLYIKIGLNKYPCKIGTFTTQMGNDAIRISGDTPLAVDGFQIVDEDDNVISDRSDYIYLYREDENCKEYTSVAEEIIPTQSYAMGDVPPSDYAILSRRISAVNNRVSDITPYTMSKTVGIQDTECVFTNVVKDEGTLTANVKTEQGEYLPCTVERADSRVRVSFDKLDTVATVTIQIQ